MEKIISERLCLIVSLSTLLRAIFVNFISKINLFAASFSHKYSNLIWSLQEMKAPVNRSQNWGKTHFWRFGSQRVGQLGQKPTPWVRFDAIVGLVKSVCPKLLHGKQFLLNNVWQNVILAKFKNFTIAWSTPVYRELEVIWKISIDKDSFVLKIVPSWSNEKEKVICHWKPFTNNSPVQ